MLSSYKLCTYKQQFEILFLLMSIFALNKATVQLVKNASVFF